jgi:hypothetical protein
VAAVAAVKRRSSRSGKTWLVIAAGRSSLAKSSCVARLASGCGIATPAASASIGRNTVSGALQAGVAGDCTRMYIDGLARDGGTRPSGVGGVGGTENKDRRITRPRIPPPLTLQSASASACRGTGRTRGCLPVRTASGKGCATCRASGASGRRRRCRGALQSPSRHHRMCLSE